MGREEAEHRTSDAGLLEAWKNGDARAGEKLFTRHADAVARFFANKVQKGAEDLVHNTFVRMLEGRGRILHKAAFRAFVLGVASNVLREHVRELKRGRNIDPDVDCLAELAPGPSSVASDRENHRLLLEGLRQLPLNDQIIIELSYWEGLDSTALGEALGMPASTVRTRLSRARDRLRQAMIDLAAPLAANAVTLEGIEAWAVDLLAQLRLEREPQR